MEKLDSLKSTKTLTNQTRQMIRRKNRITTKFRGAKLGGLSDIHRLWLSQQSSKEMQRLLELLDTARIVPAQRYKVNSIQANNLVRMMFSSRPDVPSNAKFVLFARLDEDVQRDLREEPGKALEIVGAGA